MRGKADASSKLTLIYVGRACRKHRRPSCLFRICGTVRFSRSQRMFCIPPGTLVPRITRRNYSFYLQFQPSSRTCAGLRDRTSAGITTFNGGETAGSQLREVNLRATLICHSSSSSSSIGSRTRRRRTIRQTYTNKCTKTKISSRFSRRESFRMTRVTRLRATIHPASCIPNTNRT